MGARSTKKYIGARENLTKKINGCQVDLKNIPDLHWPKKIHAREILPTKTYAARIFPIHPKQLF